jgi:hypothetical protein
LILTIASHNTIHRKSVRVSIPLIFTYIFYFINLKMHQLDDPGTLSLVGSLQVPAALHLLDGLKT